LAMPAIYFGWLGIRPVVIERWSLFGGGLLT